METRKMNESLAIKEVIITSDFWKRYRELVAEVVIPYQYETISDSNDIKLGEDAFTDLSVYDEGLKSHAIENLKIAAGLSKGKHQGMNFQDTDVYKWLEAAAYTLRYHPDEALKKTTDEVVELIGKAQEEDGYLDTIFQINMPERKFKRLDQSHELYSMGHYIEAGVAYYEATGNEQSLNIAKKMADCMYKYFGHGEDQIKGYDGHPENELALMKLWEVTKDDRYLELANYFVTERGQDPEFFLQQNIEDGIDNDFWPEIQKFGQRYYYNDQPVVCQHDAHGHAVRCVYLCVALAHLARVKDDESLKAAADRLWSNIVKKQMYITGAIGQSVHGESFTFDYDLPNDTIYGETCASVAMTFFAKQMLAGKFSSEYGDVIEKELYNGALSGMSLDGKHYFYVNPLEVDPKASELDPGKWHVLPQRQSWFGTACCPSNIARLVASVDKYLYEVKEDVILAHQFVANQSTFSQGIVIKQESNFPWDGNIDFEIDNPKQIEFKFALRVPNWSNSKFELKIDGVVTDLECEDGIIYIPIVNKNTNVILTLDMSVHIVRSNPKVKENYGKVAVQRGPIIYCAEEVDNGEDIFNLCLNKNPQFDCTFEEDSLGGVTVLKTKDVRKSTSSDEALYLIDEEIVYEDGQLKLVPYFAWANRDKGKMLVWINEK